MLSWSVYITGPLICGEKNRQNLAREAGVGNRIAALNEEHENFAARAKTALASYS
jgi:hypothetical protein